MASGPDWTAVDIIKTWWVKYVTLGAAIVCVVMLSVTPRPFYETTTGRLVKATRMLSKPDNGYRFSVKVRYEVDGQGYTVLGDIGYKNRVIKLGTPRRVFYLASDPSQASLVRPSWYFHIVVSAFLLIFMLATLGLFLMGKVVRIENSD